MRARYEQIISCRWGTSLQCFQNPKTGRTVFYEKMVLDVVWGRLPCTTFESFDYAVDGSRANLHGKNCVIEVWKDKELFLKANFPTT